MGLWSFVRPEATTNYITNPSLEEATTGYTASGGSIARSADQQTKGLYSLEVTPSGGVNDGVYYALSLTAYVEYTFSVDVWGVSGIPYRIYFYDVTAASILGTPVEFTGDGTWRRYQVSATLGANTNVRVYVVKNNHANTAEFYIDALQVEAKGYATTYCDGDEEGCEWAAGSHTSTSSRSAQSAAGGRVIDLDDDDYAFEVEQSVGVGMPPMEIIDTLPAQSDGGDYQRTIARPRSFELIETLSEASKADYHTSRLNLIKAFNPHRLASDQPVRVRYSLSGRSVEIAAYYEGGLEKGALLSPSVERMALRLKAEEPLFRAVTGHNSGDRCAGQGAMAADVQQSVSNANNIFQRAPDGTWGALGTGMSADVYALAIGPDGLLYAGGSFTTAGGTSANRVAVWDGSWSALGTGLNGVVYDLAFGPDGTLYATGTFTTAGGGGANYIASWDGSSWSALGSGLNAYGSALLVAADGTLYVTGNFTTAGGGGANYIASWDGSSWSALGSGLNVRGTCLAMSTDGTLYVGGLFTTAGGGGANYIASWDGSSWSALGSGMNQVVNDLLITADGQLHAGGGFTTPFNYLTYWNGAKWSSLGSDPGGPVYSLAEDANGVIYAGRVSGSVVKWIGGEWAGIETDLPDTPGPPVTEPTIWTIVIGADQRLTIGFDSTGSAVATGMSSVENNGTTNAYPIFKASGPGQIYQIENYTTGEGIYFSLTLQDGEEVTLDLRPGKKTFVSTFRGNIIHTILEGSDVESFHLMPGENSVSLFIDDATAEAYLVWNEYHWSIDGVVA